MESVSPPQIVDIIQRQHLFALKPGTRVKLRTVHLELLVRVTASGVSKSPLANLA